MRLVVRDVTTLLGADLAPQRPRFVRERAEPERHILEPEWVGTRALVRVGHSGGPRFRGYGGELDAPARELRRARGVARERAHVAVLRPQREHDLRSDEAGPARDEDLHRAASEVKFCQ